MKESDIITGDEREKLYKEIWEEQVIVVAKRYGISDVALRKRCMKWGIPLPPSGYWARIRAGQNVPKGGADRNLDSKRDRRMSVCIQERNA